MFSISVVVESLSHVWLLRPQGLQPARLLCPWDFPGRNTGVGCYFLLQGIFLTQRLNPCFLLGRWILYHGVTWKAQIFFIMLIKTFSPNKICIYKSLCTPESHMRSGSLSVHLLTCLQWLQFSVDKHLLSNEYKSLKGSFKSNSWIRNEKWATKCRGPAPAEPGYSKERRLGEGQGITA